MNYSYRAAQIELDKTAIEFTNLHRERQDLLAQWEETISAMERRDKSIEEAKESLLHLQVPLFPPHLSFSLIRQRKIS